MEFVVWTKEIALNKKKSSIKVKIRNKHLNLTLMKPFYRHMKELDNKDRKTNKIKHKSWLIRIKFKLN